MRRFIKYIFFALCLVFLVINITGALSEDASLDGHNTDSDYWWTGNLQVAPEGVGIYFRPSNKILHKNESIEISLLVTGDIMKDKVTGVEVKLNGIGWLAFGGSNHISQRVLPAGWRNYVSEGDKKAYIFAIVHTTEGDIFRTQSFYLSDDVIPCAHPNLVCRMGPKESGRYYTPSASDPSKHYLSKAYMNYVCEDCGYESMLEYFQPYTEDLSPIVENHVYENKARGELWEDLLEKTKEIVKIMNSTKTSSNDLLFIGYVYDTYNIPKTNADDKKAQLGMVVTILSKGFTQGMWKGINGQVASGWKLSDQNKYQRDLLENALLDCLVEGSDKKREMSQKLWNVDMVNDAVQAELAKNAKFEVGGIDVSKVSKSVMKEIYQYAVDTNNFAVYVDYLDKEKCREKANAYIKSSNEDLKKIGNALLAYSEGDNRKINNLIDERSSLSGLEAGSNMALKGILMLESRAGFLTANTLDTGSNSTVLIDLDNEMVNYASSVSAAGGVFSDAVDAYRFNMSSANYKQLLDSYLAYLDLCIQGEETFRDYYKAYNGSFAESAKRMTGSETNSMDYPDLAEKSINQLKESKKKITDLYKSVKLSLELLDNPPKCTRCGYTGLK